VLLGAWLARLRAAARATPDLAAGAADLLRRTVTPDQAFHARRESFSDLLWIGAGLGALLSHPPSRLLNMSSITGAAGGLLAEIHQALDKLRAEVLGPAVSDADLACQIDALQRVENRVAAEKLRRLNEFDGRSAYLAHGARSGGDWAARTLNLTPGQGRTLLDTAARLEDLPETADRFAQGELGPDNAATAARAAQDVAEEDLAELDKRAADAGCRKDRNQLRKDLDAFCQEKNRDHLAEKERYHHRKRSVRRWTDADGFERADVRLPGWMRAHVDAALAPLARRDSKDDARTPEQRRADALHTLCEQRLNAGDLPEVAAQRPHILVLRPHDQAEPALLDGIGPISSETEKMLTCDAEVTEIVVNHNGIPLVIHPTKKNPTLKQRLATIARDQRCIGCGAPASRCQIHHIRWRRNGGLTVVANLVLVCANCHFHIHHHGWEITQDADGKFHAAPPAEPIRHTA
jgi:hypothetical protein